LAIEPSTDNAYQVRWHLPGQTWTKRTYTHGGEARAEAKKLAALGLSVEFWQWDQNRGWWLREHWIDHEKVL
jgi:hypothetical protein